MDSDLNRYSWQSHAACKNLDTSVFFPREGGNNPPTRYLSRAINTCRACPVRSWCLVAGLDEYYGVWGGMTSRRRSSLREMWTVKGTRRISVARVKDILMDSLERIQPQRTAVSDEVLNTYPHYVGFVIKWLPSYANPYEGRSRKRSA